MQSWSRKDQLVVSYQVVTDLCCGFISHLIGRETINIPEIFSGVHGFTGKTVKDICSNVRKWSKVNVPLFPYIPKQFPCSLKVILKYSLFPKGKWLCSFVPSNPWEALKNTNSTVTAFPTCSSTFSSANELSRKSAS